MKVLRLAYPFDSMSGKLGIKQDLRYAENDNKAFESPAGHVNYARNYHPVMVAAHVARTGLNYFTIKTKSAFKATADALKQCALMGATSAIYGISIADAAKKASLDSVYALAKEAGYEGTFHKFVCAFIRASLDANAATITVSFQGTSVNLGNNPFSNAETAIAISQKLLVKFWNQLTQNGVTFTVAGAKGIGISTVEFVNWVNITRCNVLGLSLASVGPTSYVKTDDGWLLDSQENYVTGNDAPTEGAIYTLTSTAPQP